MARAGKSSGKNSSFGKRSDAENEFRKRGKNSRGESRKVGEDRNSSKPSGRFSKNEGSGDSKSRFRGKPDGERSFGSKSYSKRSDSTGGGSFRDNKEKRPYKRRDDSSDERPKRFSESSDSGRSYGNRDAKRPYTKREDSSSDSPKRFSSRSTGGSDKREYKRPFKKNDDSFSSERPKRFSKSSDSGRSYGDRDKKSPYTKREDSSSDSPKRFSSRSTGGSDKREYKRPFKKSDDSFSSERPKRFSKDSGYSKSKDREDKKPYEKEERKSFVQSRIEKQNEEVRPEYVEKKADDGLIRLNKFISNSGVCSRREADELIKMGLISVNGKTVTEMGYKVKPTDDVRHEDKRLKAEKPVYVLLNKPKGFITTTDDPQERNTVMGLVASACKERIYPVGRLDRNTTGLLLLTNDGDLTDKLTHPSYNVKKIYKVELDKPLTKNDFQKISEGVYLEEGKAMVDDIAIVSDDGLTVGLEIHIGWNRIVRRIFESLGYEVVRLDRVAYAGLDKKDLKRGQWRFLRQDEVVRLKHFK
jgi:23S rRNA pseudouridine2605 synthase